MFHFVINFFYFAWLLSFLGFLLFCHSISPLLLRFFHCFRSWLVLGTVSLLAISLFDSACINDFGWREREPAGHPQLGFAATVTVYCAYSVLTRLSLTMSSRRSTCSNACRQTCKREPKTLRKSQQNSRAVHVLAHSFICLLRIIIISGVVVWRPQIQFPNPRLP
jgi:hypothetical protein